MTQDLYTTPLSDLSHKVTEKTATSEEEQEYNTRVERLKERLKIQKTGFGSQVFEI